MYAVLPIALLLLISSVQSQLQQPLIPPLLLEWDLTNLTASTFHDTYHPLHETDEFLTRLSETFPEHVREVTIGWSSEGRELRGVVISPSNPSVPPPDMLILGAQHAREWIATSTALYLAHALALKANTSSLTHTVHIFPTPNPDGYLYTWESDRFWYKTRQLGRYPDCIGIDMNRNYGFKWKAAGCDHWFPGTRPFEAPETNAVANYASALQTPKGKGRIFVDLRSYGQMISSPYSHSCKRVPKDAEDQLEAALGASRALTSVHNTPFTVGPLCESLYRAPGNVVDWMYKKAHFKYAYAVHLRDTGTFGYVLPEEWIVPVGEETLSMIQYLAKWVSV